MALSQMSASTGAVQQQQQQQQQREHQHEQQREHQHQPQPLSPISAFYSGKRILVTGATGFIGKVLLEKLLYSCPTIDRIYLLIRGAKGRSPAERLKRMIAEKPFNVRLKQEFVASKLVAIDSDLEMAGLGLSERDKATLVDEVSLVFHVAASVKFEAPLEVNMLHNVMATRELIELACTFRQLASFVHVSTAYSNCQLFDIEERVYTIDVPEDPMRLEATKELMGTRPNSYTFTKAVAENVVKKYANRINLAIVRPSIVMSALKEPVEGWVDSVNGPIGLSVLGALGVLQMTKVNGEVVFDLIPVDIVANALISIGWAVTENKALFRSHPDDFQPLPAAGAPRQPSSRNKSPAESRPTNGLRNDTENKENINNNNNNNLMSESNYNNNNNNNDCDEIIATNQEEEAQKQQQHGKQDEKQGKQASSARRAQNVDGTLKVFNLTVGSENPCTIYKYFHAGRQEVARKPSSRALRPLLHIPKHKNVDPIVYWIYKVFSHILFAYIVDTLLAAFGQKRMVMKAVHRMHQANEMFVYFCHNQWSFATDNMKSLRQLQSRSDRDTFCCDSKAIDWDHYARISWHGCRRYILKEADDTIESARRRYTILCVAYRAFKLLLAGAATFLVKYITSFTALAGSAWLTGALLVPVYGIIYML